MNDLSVFVDESGNFGPDSKYYILALVFHNQANEVGGIIRSYREALVSRSLSDVPFHFNPLLRANGPYQYMDVAQRMKQLMSFKIFTDNVPFSYTAFIYEKAQFEDAEVLTRMMRRDLINFLFDHLEYLQAFRSIKLYYDDGQRLITKALHQAFEYALGAQTMIYRDANPSDYRLAQIVDYVCGIELTDLKYAHHDERASDVLFFGAYRDFKKTFLKKLRKKKL